MSVAAPPSGWTSLRLGDLAAVSRGASPRPIASSRWFSETSEVGWVRIADLGRSDGLTLRATTQRLSRDGIVRSRFLPSGTLIMSIAATVGLPIITGIPACIHDGFVAIERLRGVDQTFLLYALKGLEDVLRSAGQTGSQSNVNTEIVNGLLISLPPEPEQKRIADALTDADRQIATLRRSIAKKQAIKQGMMQQLLTAKTRLPGFVDPWKRLTLARLLRFQVGYPFRSAGFSSIPNGMRLIRNRDLRSNDSRIYFVGSYSREYMVNPGDVLVGMDGDFSPCRWRDSTALLNQRVGRILSNSNSIPAYIYYALQAPLKEIEGGTGATTVKHLSHRDIQSIDMVVPAVEEQRAIAGLLEDSDAEIDTLRERLFKAISIKQGMMQELLTGRTRLPVVEAAS
jgi:type I restriction enzyme S subunit